MDVVTGTMHHFQSKHSNFAKIMVGLRKNMVDSTTNDHGKIEYICVVRDTTLIFSVYRFV